MRQRGSRVYPGASPFDRRFADIGREDFERKAHFCVGQKFHQADGDRICFLARGAPRHPDPDWIFGVPVPNQGWEHLALQFFEDARFPEKRSYGDQTALAQRGGLFAVQLELPDVGFHFFESAEGHAALDAPRECAVLVVREVHPGGVPHQPEYLGQHQISRRLSRLQRVHREVGIPRDGHQLPCDSLWRQHEIRRPGGNGVSRHPVVLRSSHFLSEGGPARGLDRLQAQRAIRCGSRQNHPQGLAAPVRRQGAEK